MGRSAIFFRTYTAPNGLVRTPKWKPDAGLHRSSIATRASCIRLQWAIGLEWYLLVEDPWRVVMSTDHPNGGSFLAYPQIIRLLMDRTYRQDVLKTVHPRLRERCVLADLDREYTLNEIAIITRAGPGSHPGTSA